MQKILIIGYGSIGQRHEKNLDSIGIEVGILSRRTELSPAAFSSLEEAIEKFNPDLFLISNETSLHFEKLKEIIKFSKKKVKVLVEKPLFDDVQDISVFQSHEVFVAYHLRFHEIISRLKQSLQGQKVVSYYSYVGQYLPTWRPSRDYTETYSAKKNQGGGVLRDLSHELDLAQFILGPLQSLVSMGGKFSNLQINTDDHFSILANYKNCPMAAISMNYTDRLPARSIKVITEDDTFDCDLIRGTISSKTSNEKIIIDGNAAYIKMLETFCSQENNGQLCSLEHGLAVLTQIEAAERSASSGSRVNL